MMPRVSKLGGTPSGEAPGPLLVSVVTPSYNSRQFIGSTLRSVQAQTYRPIEHIVVDGGSTDGTVDVIRTFADAHPVRWSSQPDDGMYQAINRGLATATGQVLTYLNSDDLLVPWAVEVAVECFRRHPEADVVFGDALRWYTEVPGVDLMIQPEFDHGRVSRTGSLIQPTVFWRRRLMDRIGAFDDSLRLAADLDYWLRAGKTSTFVHLDEVVAIERIHHGGQSSRLRSAHSAEGATVRRRHHSDRSLRIARKLAARMLNGIETRRRMLDFLRTENSAAGGWRKFRSTAQAKVSFPGLLLALLTPRPLSGARARSLQMRVLRGRWIRVSEPFLKGMTEGDLD